MPERASTRIVQHLAQVVVVVLQRLFAHDDVPAAGKRPEHEHLRSGFAERECDGRGVTHGDRFYSREQRCTRTDEALWGKDEALERGLDILSSQLSAIVKLYPFAQEKRVDFAVFGYFPTVCQIGDDGLPAVPRVPPDQVIIHAALHTYTGALLMHIKVRRRAEEPVA